MNKSETENQKEQKSRENIIYPFMRKQYQILAYCKANTKNVVFYCKVIENSFDIGTIGDEIKKDMLLNDILRNKNEIGIHFYQTKSPYMTDRLYMTNQLNIIECVNNNDQVKQNYFQSFY